MLSFPLHARPTSPRLAVTAMFLMIGLLAGTWFGRIPAVTASLDLDVGQIGLLLLFFSLGALVVFQVVGKVIARFGSHRVALGFGYAFPVAMSLVAIAPNPAAFALALFVCGFSFGGLNVALNAQGVEIERRLGRPIMNTLHGWFTLGMLAGSLLAGLAVSVGLGPIPHFLGISVTALAIVLVAAPELVRDELSTEVDHGGRRRRGALLPRPLWPLAILAFCASITEGSMYDWSALFVHETLDRSESAGALTFAVFSLAVLVGRFSGDRLVTRLGAFQVVRIGGTLAGGGLVLGLAIGTLPASVTGFAALGLGISVLTPLFYSSAGSRPDIPSAQGVAAVATCGMLGLLAGPPLLGTLADVTSLRLALAMVAMPCSVIVLLAANARPVQSEGVLPGLERAT